MPFRLPNDTQRSFVCGMTGTGKTLAAGWQLSLRSYDRIPWVVIDYKKDRFIDRIEMTDEIRLDSKPPGRPGLYVVRPRPDQHDEMQAWLWKVWKDGNTGLWIDEGYMLGGQGRKSEAFDAICTQGRSKRIPLITLSQRPVWLSRFVVSESDFYQVFHLNSKGDRERVREFAPAAIEQELPQFYSHWYDVSKRFYCVLQPVPSEDTILETFYERLKLRRRLM